MKQPMNQHKAMACGDKCDQPSKAKVVAKKCGGAVKKMNCGGKAMKKGGKC